MERLHEICTSLLRQSNARGVLLVDASGATLARVGEIEMDQEPLCQIFVAGTTWNAAGLLSEGERSTRFCKGGDRHLHLSLVARGAVLAVVFDMRSSLGLVRLRVKGATRDLARPLDEAPAAPLQPPSSDR